MQTDNELNPVLGIDLGTTFSAIARWHEKRQEPRHYDHTIDKESLQSVVYCNPEIKELIVGKLAYRRGLLDPENMIQGVKRMMDNASQKITIGGQTFSPIEISAKILEYLYQDIIKQNAGKLKSRGTVVTVPYYFKAHQCENTRKAAELANINCIGLIQEPIAASLAYAWQLVQENPEGEQVSENILVFDLGGGTFDLTLFQLKQTPTKLTFEVLGTGGDDRLGGMDFDECLYKLLLEKADITLDNLSSIEQRKAHQKVLEAANEAKITLAATTETYVTVNDVLPGIHIDIKLTRSEFERSIQYYADKIDSIIQKLWATASLNPSQVDRVILVGGSSKIPLMRSLVCELIGEEKVYANTNSSLCVAEGAAIYAAYLDNLKFGRKLFGRDIIEIKTRTCHALGVEIAQGKFYELIPANRATPCQQEQLFTNDKDDMKNLDIKVYQGSSCLVQDNCKIGEINLTNLPPRPRGELNILVRFEVSDEQRLSVIVKIEDGEEQGYPFDFS